MEDDSGTPLLPVVEELLGKMIQETIEREKVVIRKEDSLEYLVALRGTEIKLLLENGDDVWFKLSSPLLTRGAHRFFFCVLKRNDPLTVRNFLFSMKELSLPLRKGATDEEGTLYFTPKARQNMIVVDHTRVLKRDNFILVWQPSIRKKKDLEECEQHDAILTLSYVTDGLQIIYAGKPHFIPLYKECAKQNNLFINTNKVYYRFTEHGLKSRICKKKD